MSYKELLKLIIPIWILVSIFFYKKSFKKTLAVKNELEILEKRLSSSSDISLKTIQLQLELNLLAGSNYNYNNDLQESILSLLSKYTIKNTIQLNNYEKPVSYEKGNQSIILFDFEVIGQPEDLISFTKSIEKKIGEKKISSLLIQSRKDGSQKNYNTYARFIIQDVKAN